MKRKILTICISACFIVTAAYAAPLLFNGQGKDPGTTEYTLKDKTQDFSSSNDGESIVATKVPEAKILLFFGTGMFGLATIIRRKAHNS